MSACLTTAPWLLLDRWIRWWKVKVKTESQDDEGPSGLVPAAYVEEVRCYM
jgi:hypothetical protein